MSTTKPTATKNTDKDSEPAQAELVDDTRPPGTGVQVVTSAGIVAPIAADNAALARYLSGSETITTQDPEAVTHGIVARILEATSLADVLNKQQVVSLRDLSMRPLKVLDVRWGESSYEGGVPFYAIMDCVDLSTGEKIVASCGGQQVLAQLFMMQKNGWLPADVQVETTMKPTSGGYFPIWLAPAPVTEPRF